MKIFRLLFLFFPIFSSTAQVGGETVYNFLTISTSAKQTALGGKTLTLIDDVNQPVWNPATINEEMNNQIAANYTSFLAGISLGSFSYAKTIGHRFGTLHANISYVNYGELIRADELGIENGTFKASDVSISVGWSKELPLEDVFVGANLKMINSTIANYSSMGIAMDIGILYRHPNSSLTMGFVARNIGTQLTTYVLDKEKLPFEIAISASYKLTYMPLKWYLTLDNLQQWDISESNPSNQTVDIDGNVSEEKISIFDNAMRHVIVGAELFPEKSINLRVGYSFRKSKEMKLQELRTFGGFSFGFGLKMNKFKLNYAYSKMHSASNVSTFSLQIDLDNKYRVR